jgi:hypothetical protein
LAAARTERWECGSEFAWLDLPKQVRSEPVPWDNGLLLFSGRDALRLVLELGVVRHGWRRLWVPDYYCQHVVAALVRPDLELLAYRDHPLTRPSCWQATRAGDAVLAVNYFGLRRGAPDLERPGAALIEDHSHDLTSSWAWTSRADFCIASMRKTLPLSDGGAVWSPQGHALPRLPPLSAQRRRAGALKLTAMMLKAMYLEGLPVSKDGYRAVAHRGEQELGRAGVSAMTEVSRAVVNSFDLRQWRQSRSRNVRTLRAGLGSLHWADLLAPEHPEGVAFGGILVVDTPQRREALRCRLLEANVYPAVLWPLEETILPIADEAREVSRRMLMIHSDGRYDGQDMARVVEVITSTAPA